MKSCLNTGLTGLTLSQLPGNLHFGAEFWTYSVSVTTNHTGLNSLEMKWTVSGLSISNHNFRLSSFPKLPSFPRSNTKPLRSSAKVFTGTFHRKQLFF